MPNILDEIVAAKTQELAQQKLAVSLADLKKTIAAQPKALSLAEPLGAGGVQLIAEVKKASPSRGLLRPNFDPVELADIYSSNGAAAISVLTDPRFQGELEHIAQIKHAGASRTAPVLRKDFIFDPYQVYEARAAGADAILLIVAILSPSQINEYLEIASELGMDCLVEVHDEQEMEIAANAGAGIIGINNRDLRTFKTDLAVTERLAPLAPKGKIVVSESGIHQPDHLTQLAGCGVNAVLVGEALVTSDDVAGKVRELAGQAVSPAKP
ncbi:MAG: indole-3-glycerol phosphate synthase TrpC [Dehalococcoidia bacterium]|nr:indole-3-glycerol phosphate synthase TrpC [Dehalococcoidia bacterium]